ncbi:hypothetical protein V8C34DRAFT_111704 [Trichoderma compactum]
MLRSLSFSVRNGMSLLLSPHNLTRGEMLGIWTPGHLVGCGPSWPATVSGEGWTSRARGDHPFPKSSLGRAQTRKDVVFFFVLGPIHRAAHTTYDIRKAKRFVMIIYTHGSHLGCMRCRDSIPGALGLHRTPTSESAGPRAAASFFFKCFFFLIVTAPS